MQPARVVELKAVLRVRRYRCRKHAIVLAGGCWTRPRLVTNHRPKPMVPILGPPFLENQAEQLHDQRLERTFSAARRPTADQDYLDDRAEIMLAGRHLKGS
jgi:CTP:phosphocholine cytidylyltransferase-like protein